MRALPDDPYTTARHLSETDRRTVRLQAHAVTPVIARPQLCRAGHSRIQFSRHIGRVRGKAYMRAMSVTFMWRDILPALALGTNDAPSRFTICAGMSIGTVVRPAVHSG